MRRRFLLEEAVLLGSLLKWLVLSTLAGIVAGIGAGLFLKILGYSVDYAAKVPLIWRLAVLPLIGGLSGWVISRFAPQAAGHGTEAVITAVHERNGHIPLPVVPVKALATVVSLAGGGSAGKEGPCAQIGSGLASSLANLLRLSPVDRRRMVICGIGAGFTAVFGTPLGGAIFGVEVLFGGALLYDVLFPSLVAGFAAYRVSQSFGVHYLRPAVSGTISNGGEPLFVKALLLGVLFGLLALAFIEALEASERLFEGLVNRFSLPAAVRPMLGGLVLVALASVAGTQYLGMGVETVEATLAGGAVVAFAFLWKLLFTAVTLGSGWSGGVILPIFFIGSTAGSVVAPLLGIDPSVGAAMGMIAVLAGATNTPIASSVIGVELFGRELGLYVAAACLASFLIAGHRSVYPSQVLVMRKTPALKVPLQRPVCEIRDVHPSTGLLRTLARWRRRSRVFRHSNGQQGARRGGASPHGGY